MILDSTYFLPLAGIDVSTDLLVAVVENRAKIGLDEVGLSSVSILELQAKARKLDIPPERVTKAVRAILGTFRVFPFYSEEVIRGAHSLRSILHDYLDAVIVATAIAAGEDLATEDSSIHKNASFIEKEYGIRIYSYRDLVL